MAVPVEQLLSKEYARNRVEATMSPTVPAQPPVQYVQPFHFDEVSVVYACPLILCAYAVLVIPIIRWCRRGHRCPSHQSVALLISPSLTSIVIW